MVRSYSSKILLFGEYGIILNSMGFAVPFPFYDGKLDYHKDKRMDDDLYNYYRYLADLNDHDKLYFNFDIESFLSDIKSGLFFNSSIPVGHGIGSSGALIAALYDRYGNNEIVDNGRLKEIFGVLESYQHGSSSGIDPLISYLGKPLLFQGDDNIRCVDIPKINQGKWSLFLLNTKISRQTAPLVNLFLEKCKNDNYRKLCNKVLLPITNNCIETFLTNDGSSLYEFYRELSDFQYRHFKEMIPPFFKTIWKRGLTSCNYYFKFCGAGGGGFLLVMTDDFAKAKSELSEFQIRPIYYLN